MAARLPRGEGGQLISTDATLRELPGLQAAGALLSRDDIEALFQQLASVALGQSCTAPVPHGNPAKAALLILRECMHHLNYGSILIEDAPPQPGSG